MKRKKIKIIITIIQILVLLAMFSNTVFAGYYNIYNPVDNPFEDSVKVIIGVLQAVGMSVAVIMLTIIGIKYIFASPDGKADLKQHLFPYLTGCVLLFGGSWLIGLIAKVAYDNIR